ncbi:hypothetical protein GCM10011610_10150 [Nocardia rhizosphaerihabitans]|uniref:Transposase n=1 Tax=Nocardia rhizosphaerihabitans TaxID=1691570 RepID=A0ABQ2K7T5_9NOCA|nr:hypothetical protein GCM10011610_10150 [Nocardia rhizosphaerihabitans]
MPEGRPALGGAVWRKGTETIVPDPPTVARHDEARRDGPVRDAQWLVLYTLGARYARPSA